MPYSDNQMLMLSGIQHFMYCPRQWALIDIEQQWTDNRLTIEGNILHKHVDDPFYRNKHNDVIILRSVNIASHTLGLYGLTDIVEMKPALTTTNAMTLPGHQGYWTPNIIEYKHGKPKTDRVDEVQLAAQVICLEEMYGIHIDKASFFYGAIRHRVPVNISPELRQVVMDCATQMHKLFDTNTIPQATYSGKCRNCSLKDLCMPQISKCSSVKTYLTNNLSQ